MTTTEELAGGRLRAAKAAYTTAAVELDAARSLLGDVVPRPGDLVLAEVLSIGQHPRLELRDGRRAMLFPGDEVIVSYGARYATDQFHAEVPADLGDCDLAAAGGLAARVVARHSGIGAPTTVRPVGVLADAAGRRMNLADWAAPAPIGAPAIPAVVVLGTSMNAGKTTTAAHLVRGLTAAGLRTGAAKATGTGAGGDRWLFADAGASPALDFTVAGLASTYGVSDRVVQQTFALLRDAIAAAGADLAVLEIADGLAQGETRALLESEVMSGVDAVVFAAGDALGAAAGVRALLELDLPVRAVSGRLTASPLASVEAAALTGLPVLGLPQLGDRAVADVLLSGATDAIAA
jgi:hypothetical protein